MKDEAHGEEDDAVIGAFDPTLQLLRAKKNFSHSCKVNGCSCISKAFTAVSWMIPETNLTYGHKFSLSLTNIKLLSITG